MIPPSATIQNNIHFRFGCTMTLQERSTKQYPGPTIMRSRPFFSFQHNLLTLFCVAFLLCSLGAPANASRTHSRHRRALFGAVRGNANGGGYYMQSHGKGKGGGVGGMMGMTSMESTAPLHIYDGPCMPAPAGKGKGKGGYY